MMTKEQQILSACTERLRDWQAEEKSYILQHQHLIEKLVSWYKSHRSNGCWTAANLLFIRQLKDKSMQSFPQQKYDCIVIDPPWFYRLRNQDKTHRNRIPYPPMKTEDIVNLPIPDLCEDKGAVLWLWTTNNHMPEACTCLQAWEFTLKTILTWSKVTKSGNVRIGTGHYLRNSSEHCLLATTGKVPSFSHRKKLTNQSTILRAQRREHSRKPEEFYHLVEHFCEGSKLELFARQQREGWDSWGNETDKFG